MAFVVPLVEYDENLRPDLSSWLFNYATEWGTQEIRARPKPRKEIPVLQRDYQLFFMRFINNYY